MGRFTPPKRAADPFRMRFWMCIFDAFSGCTPDYFFSIYVFTVFVSLQYSPVQAKCSMFYWCELALRSCVFFTGHQAMCPNPK